MDLKTIFLNEYGRLRSGFRLLIFFMAFLFIVIAITLAIRVIYLLLYNAFPVLLQAEVFQNFVFRVPYLTAALLGGYLCLRLLEGLPWRALGLTLHQKWARDLIVGSLVGIASLALAAGIAAIGGGLKFVLNTDGPAQVASSLTSSGLLFIFAALAEEAMFRGYPLQTLTRARLAWLGILLTSLPFALVHLSNPNVVPGATFANTALAGVWLAVAFLKTRSLWFPLGVHWAWNWALGSLFGLPVSGLKLVSAPLMKASDTGPAWLTGGTYGLEGGIGCTLALIISTLLIWKFPFVKPTPEMLRLTSDERPIGERD